MVVNSKCHVIEEASYRCGENADARASNGSTTTVHNHDAAEYLRKRASSTYGKYEGNIGDDNWKRPSINGNGSCGGGGMPGKCEEQESARWFSVVREWDVYVSSRCSVCATKSSSLGVVRPAVWLLEVSGTGYVWLPVVVLTLLLSQTPATIQFAINLLAGLILDLLVVGSVKALVRRPRPTIGEADMVGVIAMDKYSFPSGHATRAVMVTLLVLAECGGGGGGAGEAVSAAVASAWCVLVCASRVALGRHHVSDVLCGVVLGVAQYLLVRRYWIARHTALSLVAPLHHLYYTQHPAAAAQA